MDTVSGICKWRDRCARERRALANGKAADFSINPHRLKGMTGKIGAVEPPLSAEATMRREADIRALHEVIAASSKPPQERTARPVTESAELGWFWREAEDDGEFREGSKTCAEVRFATEFFSTFHRGLFAGGGAGGAAKPAAAKPAGK